MQRFSHKQSFVDATLSVVRLDDKTQGQPCVVQVLEEEDSDEESLNEPVNEPVDPEVAKEIYKSLLSDVKLVTAADKDITTEKLPEELDKQAVDPETLDEAQSRALVPKSSETSRLLTPKDFDMDLEPNPRTEEEAFIAYGTPADEFAALAAWEGTTPRVAPYFRPDDAAAPEPEPKLPPAKPVQINTHLRVLPRSPTQGKSACCFVSQKTKRSRVMSMLVVTWKPLYLYQKTALCRLHGIVLPCGMCNQSVNQSIIGTLS